MTGDCFQIVFTTAVTCWCFCCRADLSLPFYSFYSSSSQGNAKASFGFLNAFCRCRMRCSRICLLRMGSRFSSTFPKSAHDFLFLFFSRSSLVECSNKLGLVWLLLILTSDFEHLCPEQEKLCERLGSAKETYSISYVKKLKKWVVAGMDHRWVRCIFLFQHSHIYCSYLYPNSKLNEFSHLPH